MSHAKATAGQYLEIFAAEVYQAKINNRPIDQKIWDNMVFFMARGLAGG